MSEEREAFRAWFYSFAEIPPFEATWMAALKWQATRRTAHLSNLLARIHRDGGHYEAEHGTEKAVAEAEKRIAELNGGATGQEPIYAYEWDEYPGVVYRDFEYCCRNGRYPDRTLTLYAATIGANEVKDCNVDKYVSRMCEHGTKGCTTEHAQAAESKRPSTLSEQIKQAEAEVATWSPERKANVRLQGSDPYVAESKRVELEECAKKLLDFVDDLLLPVQAYTEVQETLERLRGLLARAQAKGE